MARSTIDFGIDLGTTNSAIAKLNGTDTEAIKNNEGFETTPSAVWLDKNQKLYRGKPAYERLVLEPHNAFGEFKIQMGTSAEYIFKRNGQSMKPEELSAEVLKSLKEAVLQKTGENLQASVITVPAAFELPQNDATVRAAKLAGIEIAPLLQEPIAAAIAYGFQSDEKKAYWLVYDLGGGTFDAALIQVRDGSIRVVTDGGDNHLGGKLIDWAIVQELLVPTLKKQYKLTDFTRGNENWLSAFAKLKQQAEIAKISLSQYESTQIRFDYLCHDDDGEAITDFDFDLQRSDVEQLAEPFILRSINLCKAALQEKGLSRDSIEKVLLVGGPTLMPYLRERLADAHEGLGIPLEFRLDPLTVVARGAAIFGGTQRLINSASITFSRKAYRVELEYNPIGPDIDPLIGGKVIGSDGERFSGFTIEFVNDEARPAWRSGKIQLESDGFFETTLLVERKKRNTFSIELCDAIGTRREIEPDTIPYTVGQTITAQTLTHDISLALANNTVGKIFSKGTELPVRRSNLKVTAAYEVKRGDGQAIRIPIVEGESKKADRNTKIGHLEIPSDKIKRDVPAGSEVEVTIEIDASRCVTLEAYLPILDQDFLGVMNRDDYGKEATTPLELEEEFYWQKKRLDKAEKISWQIQHTEAQTSLSRIEKEGLTNQIETSLSAAYTDVNAASEAHATLDIYSRYFLETVYTDQMGYILYKVK